MSGTVLVHAVVIAKPEYLEQVKQAMSELRDYANKEEEGTLVYRVSVNKENPNKLEVFEEYADQKAAEAHLAGKPFQTLKKNAVEWLSTPPTISFSKEL